MRLLSKKPPKVPSLEFYRILGVCVLTLYVRYFSRYLGTYIHTDIHIDRQTYIQKASFYYIDVKPDSVCVDPTRLGLPRLTKDYGTGQAPWNFDLANTFWNTKNFFLEIYKLILNSSNNFIMLTGLCKWLCLCRNTQCN